jgi:hypothetical protein
MAWSEGADRHLEPGETETVTVNVVFPRAASNDCQGKTGGLTIRRSTLQSRRRRAVYECRPSPWSRLWRRRRHDHDLEEDFCALVNSPLHKVLDGWSGLSGKQRG